MEELEGDEWDKNSNHMSIGVLIFKKMVVVMEANYFWKDTSIVWLNSKMLWKAMVSAGAFKLDH